MNVKTLFILIFILHGCKQTHDIFQEPSKDLKQLRFSETHDPEIQFLYSDTIGNAYLKKLREENYLMLHTSNCETDVERIITLTSWVNSLWSHDGSNEPQKGDALSILDEVKQGKHFRCVEYGVVLSAALNAVGVPARVLSLKTSDVEYVAFGAGHVCVEAYSRELNKWVLADAQFNAILFQDSIPLNAVELQRAIVNHEPIHVVNSFGTDMFSDTHYSEFISPYLYYFDVPFDNRCEVISERFKVKGKRKLMLVPSGAKNPKTFQVKYKIDYCHYTNSLADFYPILAIK